MTVGNFSFNKKSDFTKPTHESTNFVKFFEKDGTKKLVKKLCSVENIYLLITKPIVPVDRPTLSL